MNDKPFVAVGAAAAFIDADNNTANVRPGGKFVPRWRCLEWEDATQEEREDKNLRWITDRRLVGDRKYCIVKLTKEQERERYLNKQYHMLQMVNYILKKYGHEVWNEVAHSNYAAVFTRYGINLNIDYPHCAFADGQCDLFCPFYRGGCRFVDILDQPVVDT